MQEKWKYGKVIAVCTSPNPGVPKYARDKVVVGEWGLVDDFHNKEYRRSFSKPGTTKLNTDRQITICAQEAYDYLNRELGTSLSAGSFAENILVSGFGDLSDVKPGAIFSVKDEIVFRVVEQNEPCINLQPYHRLMAKKAYGRRGLLCAIVRGQGRVIIPGNDTCLHEDGDAFDRRIYFDKLIASQDGHGPGYWME